MYIMVKVLGVVVQKKPKLSYIIYKWSLIYCAADKMNFMMLVAV